MTYNHPLGLRIGGIPDWPTFVTRNIDTAMITAYDNGSGRESRAPEERAPELDRFWKHEETGAIRIGHGKSRGHPLKDDLVLL